MNKLTRFFKTSAIYFAGNVLSKLVAFILLPLYTIYIRPEQYGEYDLVLTFINLVAPVAFFQIWDGMFRFSFDSEKKDDKYKIINNAIIVFSVGFLLYGAIFFALYKYYHFEYWVDALGYGALFAVHYIYSFSARIFLDNVLFVSSGVINTVLTALINVVLIVKFGWDVRSLYISASIGCLAQIVIIEIKLKLLSHFSSSDIYPEICRKLLKFSFPLCLATVSYWLLSGFTRVSIVNQLGNSENGQFAVASRFASMITIIVNVFQFAWNELAYIISGDSDIKQKYEESSNLHFKSMVFGSDILCIIIKVVYPYVIDVKYDSALELVPITIMGVAFNSMAGFLGTFFMAEKKTNHILYTTVIAAMLNCILCYTMIGTWGLSGAAWILTISFLLLMAMRLFILSRKFAVLFELKNYLYLVAFAVMLLTYYYKTPVWIDTLLVLGLCFVYLVTTRKYINIYLLNKRK